MYNRHQQCPLELRQTKTTATLRWKRNVHVSFLLNISRVLGSHGEWNTEVFLHRVGVQLEGWEASEETKLLAGCRPYSECSSYNQTHCISLLFNLVSTYSSVSSESCCVSSVQPFKKSPLYCTLILWNEAKRLDLFGNTLPDSTLEASKHTVWGPCLLPLS